MAREYDRNLDPTLVGANGGYGDELMPSGPTTPEQDAAMWKRAFQMERDENMELKRKMERMQRTDDVKWALVDLLKLLAVVHSDNSADSQFFGPYGPEFQAELVRIAKTLGVELPPPPPVEEVEV